MEAKRTVQPKGTIGFKLFVFPIIFFFASLPFIFTQTLGNAVYFILYKLLKYRVKVVKENLKNSFPNKSVSEILYRLVSSGRFPRASIYCTSSGLGLGVGVGGT
jgi:lauroyl/myristoyl acyltransferase